MSNSKDKGINFFKDVNLGGISSSDYQGIPNSVAELVGLNIHSEGGILKCNQKLTAITGDDPIDDFVKAKVSCSDGAAYLFGNTNGKVWRVTPNGTLTFQATVAAGVISAEEYDGYIYYTTKNSVGRVAVPTAGYVNWSGKSDTWKTFTNKDDFHPMKVLNLILYIGDGNLVAQVREGVFTADALDIKKPFRIKALGENVLMTELLIGTHVSDNVNWASVLRWNTWSPSYTVEDKVPEDSINAFLKMDNVVLVSAGNQGAIYSHDGSILSFEKKLKGDFENTKCTVFNDAVANHKGLPLFAVSQVSGNGIKYGIYGLGKFAPEYPVVTSVEYIGSHGMEIDVEYGALINTADGFLVTWKKTVDDTVTYGLDKLDTSNKASGYITSRIIMIDRTSKTNYGRFEIPYQSIPENTDIKLFVSINGSAFGEFDLTEDDERKTFVSDIDLDEMVFGQIKLQLIPNSNDTPEVQMGLLNIKN